MPRWVVVTVLAAMAALPGRALAADCASIGPAGQYDVFTAGSFTANTGGATIEGRVGAGGDATVQGITLGTNPPLTPDPSRADLAVGGNLTVGGGGGSVPNGRVTYGGTLTATGTLNALGGLHQAPFDVADDFATVRDLSAQWAGLTANGTVSGPTYDVRLNGTDSARNVFAVTTAQLQGIGKLTITVPAGSTTLINVTGSTFASNLYGIDLVGATPATVLWNFPLATSVQQASGLNWQGTLVAPHAGVSVSNGNFYGQILGDHATIGSEGSFHRPFTGCLPPLPARDLTLVSLCTDPVTNHHAMRLRNLGDSAHKVTWSDRDSAQGDTFTASAGTDTFFDVLDGRSVHHIVVTSGSTTLEQTTSTRLCAGTITLLKRVTGDLSAAPAGPWRIHIDGDNGFSAIRDLHDGEQAAVAVPGSFQAGSVPVGEVAGGARYVISEPDPLGGVASIDKPLVTILDGQSELVTIANAFASVVPPEPSPEPQPPLPPGPPDPLPGPDLITAASLAGGADVAVTALISPRVSAVGDVVDVTVRLRNNGPLPAVDALVREVPQVDPKDPNQVARILGVNAGVRAAGCTSSRPVSCGGATLAAGAEVVVHVKARMLLGGIYKSVVVATSRTPDPNTTNNFAANGLVVRRPAGVRVSVQAPALTRVGDPVAYRVVARGAGRHGAEAVRFCHRLPAGLLMTSAPGTFRYRGRVCRDVASLRPGQRAAFTVRAIAAASAGGRTLHLRATATAPGARLAIGSDRMAVVAQSFAGTGRG
jgi:choice-of-anchor A domain-containing protein